MLYTILKHIRNFFTTHTVFNGSFTAENGVLEGFKLKDGQFFLIEGSVCNDGIHRFGEADLINEEFDGSVTPLAIPAEFLALVEEIEEFCSKNHEESAFTSESFGGYSYTKATNKTGRRHHGQMFLHLNLMRGEKSDVTCYKCS